MAQPTPSFPERRVGAIRWRAQLTTIVDRSPQRAPSGLTETLIPPPLPKKKKKRSLPSHEPRGYFTRLLTQFTTTVL